MDGSSRVRTETTVACNEGDEGVEHYFTVRDASNTERAVTFVCQAPSIVYNNDKVGYIPNAVFPSPGKVCSSNTPPGTVANALDSDIPFTPLPFEEYGTFTPLGHMHKRHPSILKHLPPHDPEEVPDPYAPIVTADRMADEEAANDHFMGLLRKHQYDYMTSHPLARRLLNYPQAPSSQTRFVQSSLMQNRASGQPTDAPPEYDSTGATPTSPPFAVNESVINWPGTGGTAYANANLATTLSFAVIVPYGWVGVAINIFCDQFSLCFGSGVDLKALKEAFKAIDTQFRNIERQLNDITTWINQQVQFDDYVLDQFAAQNRLNQQIQEEISRNTENIAFLTSWVVDIANVTAAISTAVNENFRQVSEQLHQGAAVDASIIQYVSALQNATLQKFQELSEALIESNRAQRRIDTTVLTMLKRVSMRRALIETFWLLNDVDTEPPSTPFLIYDGIRPITRSERATLRKLSAAVSLGQVVLERTQARSPTRYAQVWTLDYKCDPLFILDNHVSGMDFQTIFDFIGPSGCYPGAPASAWTCSCVVHVTYKECSLNSDSMAFPWAQAQTTYLKAPGETNSTCSLAIQSYPVGNDNNLVPAYSGFKSVLTNVAELQSFLQTFCSDTSMYRIRTHGIIFVSDHRVCRRRCGKPGRCHIQPWDQPRCRFQGPYVRDSLASLRRPRVKPSQCIHCVRPGLRGYLRCERRVF